MVSTAHEADAAVATPRWGRSLAVYAALLAVLAGLAIAWIATRPTPSYEQGPGSLALSATDYAFTPSSATWQVGERVRLTIDNDSEANPGKAHEFMMGRQPVLGETAFGPWPTGGFVTDFFAGVQVDIVRAQGLQMVMPAEARVRQEQIDRSVSGGMGGMEMGGAGAAGEGESGFMLMLDPGGSVTISFVVPDRPGSWEFGCFQQTGQHYTNGMKGRVTVEPA